MTKNFIVGFISRNEFADVMKLILHNDKDDGHVNDAYIEELATAMDFDKNGKIDMNEFLESFRIVQKKPKSTNGHNKHPSPDLPRHHHAHNTRT